MPDIARLYDQYKKEIIPSLVKECGFKNINQVPKLSKVIINMGLGAEAVKDKKKVEAALDDLKMISGQLPVITYAKKAIANFKIKENMPIGCKVTIRKNKMYEFIDRLINIALPRTKDFRGLSQKSFDGAGNYTFGVKEHIIFPEIDFDKIDQVKGMDITIVTSTNNDKYAQSLLKAFNFPLK